MGFNATYIVAVSFIGEGNQRKQWSAASHRQTFIKRLESQKIKKSLESRNSNDLNRIRMKYEKKYKQTGMTIQ